MYSKSLHNFLLLLSNFYAVFRFISLVSIRPNMRTDLGLTGPSLTETHENQYIPSEDTTRNFYYHNIYWEKGFVIFIKIILHIAQI